MRREGGPRKFGIGPERKTSTLEGKDDGARGASEGLRRDLRCLANGNREMVQYRTFQLDRSS